jgi:hypothetical protein
MIDLGESCCWVYEEDGQQAPCSVMAQAKKNSRRAVFFLPCATLHYWTILAVDGA